MFVCLTLFIYLLYNVASDISVLTFLNPWKMQHNFYCCFSEEINVERIVATMVRGCHDKPVIISQLAIISLHLQWWIGSTCKMNRCLPLCGNMRSGKKNAIIWLLVILRKITGKSIYFRMHDNALKKAEERGKGEGEGTRVRRRGRGGKRRLERIVSKGEE